MKEDVSETMVIRHAAYRNYAKEISEKIHRGKFWTGRSSQFDAVLTPRGYRSKRQVKVSYLPWTYSKLHKLFHKIPGDLWTQFCSLRTTYDRWNESTVISREKALFNQKEFSINSHYLQKEYYFFRIRHGGACPGISLEIGAGGGMLSGLLHHFCRSKIIIIDLPEMVSVSSAFLFFMFPNSRFLLPNEIGREEPKIDDYDIIWLLPSQLTYLNGLEVDLAVNTASFMEMDVDEVKKYFDLIDKTLKVGGYFYCANRLNKVTSFNEYPWRTNYRDVFREPFLFSRVVKNAFAERLQEKLESH